MTVPSSPKVSKIYKCLICSFSTQSTTSIAKHRRLCNDESTNPCEIYSNPQDNPASCWYVIRPKTQLAKFRQNAEKVINRPKRRNYHANVKTIFDCEQCSFISRERSKLTQHVISKHIIKEYENTPHLAETYRCPHCPRFFQFKISLVDHVNSKHNKKKLYCGHCLHDAKFTIRLQKLHIGQRGDKNKIGLLHCAHCKYAAKCETSLGQHQIEAHGIMHFMECRKWHCEYRTQKEDFFKEHLRSAHHETKEWLQCKKCSYSCKNKVKFQKHIDLYHDFGQVTNRPNRSSTLRTVPEDIGRKVLGDFMKWWQCIGCPFHTLIRQELDEHNKVPKHCQLCDFQSVCEAGLIKHMLGHNTSAELWLHCDVCEYRTKGKKNLNKHQALVHSSLPQSGQNDSKSVIQPNVERPMKIRHTELRSRNRQNNAKYQYKIVREDNNELFHCEHCTYRTEIEENMKQHIILLNMEGWMKCERCKFRTKRKSKLDEHAVVHLGTGKCNKLRLKKENRQKFECTPCNYSTLHEQKYQDHLVLKHEDGWLTCELCSFRTKTRKQITEHRTIHPIKIKSNNGSTEERPSSSKC